MGIDSKTTPRSMNISISTDPKYLAMLKHCGDIEFGTDAKLLNVNDEQHSFITDELYYNEEYNELVYSGRMAQEHGETSICFTLPLSDTVMIDILAGAMKRFNKFKTVLETLKNK